MIYSFRTPRYISVVVTILVFLGTTPTELRGQDFQYKDFTPLNIGDSWEYVYTHQDLSYGQPPGDPVILGYQKFRVVSDTLIDGEPYRVAVREQYDADQTLEQIDSCVARTDSDGTITFPRFPGACPWDNVWGNFWGSLPPPQRDDGSTRYNQVDEDVEIRVGERPYHMPWVAIVRGSGAHTVGWRIYFGYELGLYEWVYEVLPEEIRTPDGYRRSYSLSYANVGGQSYGATVVASEPPTQPSPSLNFRSAYPNPFSETLWLDVNGSVGTATVEMFDLLGRKVHSQQAFIDGKISPIPINAAPLAPGTYMVRIRTSSGHTITRPIVKR